MSEYRPIITPPGSRRIDFGDRFTSGFSKKEWIKTAQRTIEDFFEELKRKGLVSDKRRRYGHPFSDHAKYADSWTIGVIGMGYYFDTLRSFHSQDKGEGEHFIIQPKGISYVLKRDGTVVEQYEIADSFFRRKGTKAEAKKVSDKLRRALSGARVGLEDERNARYRESLRHEEWSFSHGRRSR